MRKIILILAFAALVFAACQKDDAGSSAADSATHYYTIATDDMSWGKADMSYIAAFFPDSVRMFTAQGSTASADLQARHRYDSILALIDDQAVCALFPAEYDENLEEYLYYEVHLLRTEGQPDTLASKHWSYDGTYTR